MGKKNKKVARGAQQRERFNYLTGKTEIVPGTKAGKRRTRLSYGDPLRTHDLHGPVGKKKKLTKSQRRSQED
jgi:hypothetical protein